MTTATATGLSALDAYSKIWGKDDLNFEPHDYKLIQGCDGDKDISIIEAEEILQNNKKNNTNEKLVVFAKTKTKDVYVLISEHFIDTPEEKVHITETQDSSYDAAFALSLAAGFSNDPYLPELAQHTRKFNRAIKECVDAVERYKIPLVVRDVETKKPCYTVTPAIVNEFPDIQLSHCCHRMPLYTYVFMFDA